MKTAYTYYNDPGHGWLKVERKELVDLGILDKISHYSYQRGESVYLEEDCDASAFIAAKQKAMPGVQLKFTDRHADRSSKIRSYDSYKVAV